MKTRITVNGGGCSGLSYKMDFDNEMKADDQEFEDEDAACTAPADPAPSV